MSKGERMSIRTKRMAANFGLFCFLLLASERIVACLWDYDTLSMERKRFPEAHELIAGYFLRHSDAYYEWRLADRLAKQVNERTAMDLDDIAVAYEKLDRHDEAIAAICERMKRWPEEGRYESEANLGTFLIHSGKLDKGLEHIATAIELNPDAHFGREKYQKLLVEYVLETRKVHQDLPLRPDSSYGRRFGFAEFALETSEIGPATDAEAQAAIKGVLGMMRFGRHDSPILLEALGDLLLSAGEFNDSKMLAARAYLKASYEVESVEASYRFRMKAKEAINMQFGRSLDEIEADLQDEIAQGFKLALEIAAKERRWVAE